MHAPLVSIIIPTFNYGKFIGETLQCLRNQDYQNFEIIIVDDGSTDNTKEIVAKFVELDARIKYFYQINSGPSVARNLGLKQANGEFIQFLDADDLLSNNKISLQVKFLTENLNIDISYTSAFYFKDGCVEKLYQSLDLSQNSWMPKISGSGYPLLEYLVRQNILPINCALIRKTALNHDHQFMPNFYGVEDWYFWLDLAFNHTSFHYLEEKEAYVLIRVHAGSLSQNRHNMYWFEVKLRMQIKEWIKKSTFLNIKESNYLINLNQERLKFVLFLIYSSSKFSLKLIFKMINLVGFWNLIDLFFKMLKDIRKGNLALL